MVGDSQGYIWFGTWRDERPRRYGLVSHQCSYPIKSGPLCFPSGTGTAGAVGDVQPREQMRVLCLPDEQVESVVAHALARRGEVHGGA